MPSELIATCDVCGEQQSRRFESAWPPPKLLVIWEGGGLCPDCVAAVTEFLRQRKSEWEKGRAQD